MLLKKATLSLLLLMSVFVPQAYSAKSQAYYRTYWNPKYHEQLLDYCLYQNKQCGKAVADQYCQIMGYDRSVKSTIAYNVGLTNYFNHCTGCKGWACNGFKLIKCVAEARHEPVRPYYFRSRRFVYPRANHYRVDWCYEQGKFCGKRAAFSFCRRMGYEHVQDFEKSEHIAATRSLGDQRLCFGEQCNAFKSITCHR